MCTKVLGTRRHHYNLLLNVSERITGIDTHMYSYVCIYTYIYLSLYKQISISSVYLERERERETNGKANGQNENTSVNLDKWFYGKSLFLKFS